MHICHVTAHLPPDQAANSLLPFHLGTWARAAGDSIDYIAHPPRTVDPSGTGATESQLAVHAAALPGSVTWVKARPRSGGIAHAIGLSAIADARRMREMIAPVVAGADIVHVHSNGLLPELAAWIAGRQRKPVVMTLYGTEIWHYQRRWPRPDLFTRAYQSASRVTFYSRGLLDYAVGRGLQRKGLSVIYPPVADQFARPDRAKQQAVRRSLGIAERFVLLNVKRLHPLAGQRYLIEAMPAVLRDAPDTRLVICGTGPLRSELEEQANALGVASRVTFAGLVDNRSVADYYAAADLFVLPSLLEACPTVAVEALASGTPVLSADHPGGVELASLFGSDVLVVPREDPDAIARAIAAFLRHPVRATAGAAAVVAREFSPGIVASRFAAVYQDVLTERR
ncbi:MAG: glycosyltransferase [Acidobacteria bacterium]|nr:glycosyltransferase [Acidobacteriota bacterium]